MKPTKLAPCLIIGLLAATQVSAQIVTKNGATPTEGVQTIVLEEQWRVGGEDDDIFFGTVSGAVSADNGNLYVLDGQLSQIQAYSPDGEWLMTLSGEGDGPGEVRNPGGIFVDRAGELCMLNGMRGQIVRVNPDNTPAEVLQYTNEAGGGMTIMLGGTVAGDGFMLAGINIIFGQGGGSGQKYFLTRCDAQGTAQHTILEKMHPIDYSDFVLDELSMDFAWNRWTVDADGRMYVAPDRNDYRIEVYSPQGELEHVISREYESFPRDEELKRLATLVIEGVGAYHPVPLKGVTIEEFEPDIMSMWMTPEGELWVHTSRGINEAPAGAYALYDVFSPEGEFVRQVAVECEADAKKDSLAMLDDGRIVVVTGILDAWLSQQSVERSEEEKDAADANPLEVVIYALK